MLSFFTIDNTVIAELTDDNPILSEVQDFLDLMGDCGYNNCNSLILSEKVLHPDFFRLHTKLAGEILQKFSTYDFKLAITGDFSRFSSKNLQDFIRESNKGNRIFFVANREEAVMKLNRKR